jgi:chaperonin cofactor prefoldin
MSFAQSPDSDEISNLLKRAASHATQADKDAATLESYARNRASWHSNANQLQLIKEHVNELGKLSSDLSAKRDLGSPWQKMAIDQVDARLRELADVLTITINHLNENQSRVHMPEYRDYVKANYELTSRIAQMIHDFVDYDKAKSTADLLEQKLQLPATQSAE